MYFFISYLRVIAAVLITNSHYAQIWPIADMAVGGMIGNILFFAVSGFCLYHVKGNFGKWILKRILKIYPVMIGFTLLTILIGDFSINSGKDLVYFFVYPTNYIFLVWLMISYVAFYFVTWISKTYQKCLEITLLVLLSAWILTYFLAVDKSIYHIDEVSKPFILFLYFASMLMGALFKKHEIKFQRVRLSHVLLLPLSLLVYFGSKVAFSKIEKIVFWQILNQASILFVLYLIFALALSCESKMKVGPKWLNRGITFLSKMTLHIYIVQFAVIRRLETLSFPINFVVVTVAILALAIAVYHVEQFIRQGLVTLFQRTDKEEKNAKDSN